MAVIDLRREHVISPCANDGPKAGIVTGSVAQADVLICGILQATDIVGCIATSKPARQDAEDAFQIARLQTAVAALMTQAAGIRRALVEKDALIRQLQDQQVSMESERPYCWTVAEPVREGAVRAS